MSQIKLFVSYELRIENQIAGTKTNNTIIEVPHMPKTVKDIRSIEDRIMTNENLTSNYVFYCCVILNYMWVGNHD